MQTLPLSRSRAHSDIGLKIARQQSCSGLAATCAMKLQLAREELHSQKRVSCNESVDILQQTCYQQAYIRMRYQNDYVYFVVILYNMK